MEAFSEMERHENGNLSRETPIALPGILELIQLIDHLAES